MKACVAHVDSAVFMLVHIGMLLHPAISDLPALFRAMMEIPFYTCSLSDLLAFSRAMKKVLRQERLHFDPKLYCELLRSVLRAEGILRDQAGCIK